MMASGRTRHLSLTEVIYAETHLRGAAPMWRRFACVITSLLAVSALAGAQTVKPGPEHARLTAMCGSWDVEMTFWFRPGGTPASIKGTSVIRPLFDGLFVEEKIDGVLNRTPFTTLAWTGFNSATRQYEATRIASTNTLRIAEAGGYD